MGPLAQTQTLRDFEQVRPRGAGTPAMAPPSPPLPPSSTTGYLQDTCRIPWVHQWGAEGGRGTQSKRRWDGERGLSPPPGATLPLAALLAEARGGRGGSGFTTLPSPPSPLRRFLK